MKSETSRRATLDWKVSRTGVRVPVIDGRACHSLVDPMQEARKWAEHVLEKCRAPIRNLYILGGGAGFHIRALEDLLDGRKITLVVVEKNEELLFELANQFAYDSGVLLIGEADIRSGKLDHLLNDRNENCFSLAALTFQPACQSAVPFYSEWRQYILGHTRARWQVEFAMRFGASEAMRFSFYDECSARNQHPIRQFAAEAGLPDPVTATIEELFT